jgi:hypothetical protein
LLLVAAPRVLLLSGMRFRRNRDGPTAAAPGTAGTAKSPQGDFVAGDSRLASDVASRRAR